MKIFILKKHLRLINILYNIMIRQFPTCALLSQGSIVLNVRLLRRIVRMVGKNPLTVQGNIMKKYLIIIISAALLLATSASADPVGIWEITMDGPGGKRVNHLTIRKEGDKHFASMAMPQGEVDIGEIRVEGDHIEITVAPVKDYPTMTYSYACDVDGDNLTGQVRTPRRGTLPFTGIRQ